MRGAGRALFFTVALASTSAGCLQTECEAHCEGARVCSRGDEDELFVGIDDCENACDLLEEPSDRAGCGAEWDDLHGCGAAQAEQSCDAIVCRQEARAWTECVDAAR